MRQIGAGDAEPDGLGSGRQQQPVEGGRLAAGDDLALLRVDAGDLGIEMQIDAVFGVIGIRAQRQPIFRRAAGEIILREIGPVDRRGAFVAVHRDAAAEAAPPQHFGRRKACRAAADDDDPVGAVFCRGGLGRGLGFRLRQFLFDENLAVALFDLPAIDRAQSGSAYGLAGTQIEAGMVPGAPHRCADDKTVRQRPVIMAAMGTDGKKLRSGLNHKHGFIADMAGQTAVNEFGDRGAFGQVGAARSGSFVGHGRLARSERA